MPTTVMNHGFVARNALRRNFDAMELTSVYRPSCYATAMRTVEEVKTSYSARVNVEQDLDGVICQKGAFPSGRFVTASPTAPMELTRRTVAVGSAREMGRHCAKTRKSASIDRVFVTVSLTALTVMTNRNVLVAALDLRLTSWIAICYCVPMEGTITGSTHAAVF